MTGKKRSSPGGGDAANGSNELDLTEEQVHSLDISQKALDRVELFLLYQRFKELEPIYTGRREILKTIPKFWPAALSRQPSIAVQSQHVSDQDALSYLDDIWVTRDIVEPRAFKIHFHFKENPYFTNEVLIKDYQYTGMPNTTASNSDGMTEAQLDFKEDRDIKPQAFKIDWSSDSKNLVQLYPRKVDADDDEEIQDMGSFFNWFTQEGDEYGMGDAVVEVFEGAIDFFFGRVGLDDEDITDSDEEAEDDGDEEIDLEQPKKKARKA